MERAPRGRDVIAPQRSIKPVVSTTGEGPPCPTNAAHGRLLWISGRLYCPHSQHDGRLATHPEGGSPPTKNLWHQEELDQLMKEKAK